MGVSLAWKTCLYLKEILCHSTRYQAVETMDFKEMRTPPRNLRVGEGKGPTQNEMGYSSNNKSDRFPG